MPEVKGPNPTVVVILLRQSSYSSISYSKHFLQFICTCYPAHSTSGQKITQPLLRGDSSTPLMSFSQMWRRGQHDDGPGGGGLGGWQGGQQGGDGEGFTQPLRCLFDVLLSDVRGGATNSNQHTLSISPPPLSWYGTDADIQSRDNFLLKKWNGCQGCRRNAYQLCSSTQYVAHLRCWVCPFCMWCCSSLSGHCLVIEWSQIRWYESYDHWPSLSILRLESEI